MVGRSENEERRVEERWCGGRKGMGEGCLRLYNERRDWGFKRLNSSIHCQIKEQLGDSCLNVDPVAFFDYLFFPWIKP